jgi:hypothetical protein
LEGELEMALFGATTMVVLCLVGLLMLAGLAGMVILLLKLGVIGSYWLKSEVSSDEVADYRLDQSHEV